MIGQDGKANFVDQELWRRAQSSSTYQDQADNVPRSSLVAELEALSSLVESGGWKLLVKALEGSISSSKASLASDKIDSHQAFRLLGDMQAVERLLSYPSAKIASLRETLEFLK